MRLLNVSAGQVQAVQIGSEVVRTAHVKAPIAEPWLIGPEGVAGDQRAVHPDKLYGFARAGYDHWGAHLGIEPETWPDGFFGENLTLDELDETDVRLGDEFKLGDAVLFVSGARTPCVKLAWRLGQPRSFQGVFARSRRTGVYFGVREPGQVRAGDRLERIRHNPAMPSIADLCDFVRSHEPLPLEPLQRLLDFDGLSATLRLLLGAKLRAAEQAAAGGVAPWRGWRDFTVAKVVSETDQVRTLVLAPEDGQPLPRSRPGQFVSVRVPTAHGALIRRWSLSHHQCDPLDYRITVKRQGGYGSQWVHDAEVGARVALRAPAGRFFLDTGSFRPIALVAAGIGITPLRAMLLAQLERPEPNPVYLIYGARTPEEAPFRAELEALAATDSRIRLVWVFSQAGEGRYARRRVSAALVREALADLHVTLPGDHRVDLPWFEADIYLCGPASMCDALIADLIDAGANPDHLFTERFDAAELGDTDVERARIHFARSGRELVWDAAEDPSILELAESNGIAIPNECRAGTCLTCRTPLLNGRVTAELGDGTALLCVARPSEELIVVDC